MTISRSIAYGDTQLSQGGLMRCCIKTINDYVDTHMNDESTNGLVLDCAYEAPGNAKIVLDRGVWRYNHDLDLPIELLCVCSEEWCWCNQHVTITVGEADALMSNPDYELPCPRCKMGEHVNRP